MLLWYTKPNGLDWQQMVLRLGLAFCDFLGIEVSPWPGENKRSVRLATTGKCCLQSLHNRMSATKVFWSRSMHTDEMSRTKPSLSPKNQLGGCCRHRWTAAAGWKEIGYSTAGKIDEKTSEWAGTNFVGWLNWATRPISILARHLRGRYYTKLEPMCIKTGIHQDLSTSW